VFHHLRIAEQPLQKRQVRFAPRLETNPSALARATTTSLINASPVPRRDPPIDGDE
jgi:hypothetical protein